MAPEEELRVEEDLVVGTVRFDSAEESLVRKLAFERLRRSLKKGMFVSDAVKPPKEDSVEDVFSKRSPFYEGCRERGPRQVLSIESGGRFQKSDKIA